MSTSEEIIYSKVPVDKWREVADFLLGSFFLDEPLGIALGLPVSQASPWIPPFIEKAVEQNSSFMAVDSSNGKIVGVIVNIINRADGVGNINMGSFLDPERDPIMGIIGRFLGELNTDIQRPNNPDRILACCFLNVLSDYCGRGIGKTLTLKSQEYALSIGINSLQVDVTSHFSYRAFQKVGYETLKEVKYEDWEDNGVKVLKGKDMGVHTHARILYKVVDGN